MTCTSCGASFRPAAGTTAAWMPAENQRALGKFELQDLVGAGAFGSVYKALDTELGRIVAVKVPRAGNLGSSGDVDRFLREARSVAQLRHPSIVPVFEIGQESGLPYLVSEFVHGITLADLLTGERLPPRAAAELVSQIADALHHAHGQGVIHRDVKPSNIMLEKGGPASPAASPGRYIPRLMDFGLAKRDAGEMTMTVEGQVLGTPAYMSPEQARGEAHSVDGRSDVYSLGVILYQILTGELPFKGNARMLLHHVLHDEPKPPRSRDPKVPRDLETVCLKAMAKEPARRYATAGELAADLRRFLNDEPIRARPVSLYEKLWRRIRRNPAVTGLAATVVLLTGVVIGIMANMSGKSASPSGPPGVVANTQGDTSADELLEVVAELDRTDPGWRLEQIEAKRKVISEDENGAVQIRKVIKLLSAAKVLDASFYQRTARFAPLPQRLSEDDAAFLRVSLLKLDEKNAARSEARRMLSFPEGRLEIGWGRTGFDTRLERQTETREIVRLLSWDARLLAHEGDVIGALHCCRCVLNCSRVIGDEPAAPSQLIRLALANVTVGMVENSLAHGEVDEAELAALQSAITVEVDHPGLRSMARGERGSTHWALSAIAAGDLSPADVAKMYPDAGIRFDQWPTGSAIRGPHAQVLRDMTRWVEITGRPLHEQPALMEAWANSVPPSSRQLMVNFKDLAKLTESCVRTRANLVATQASVAAERYRRARGEWPRDLAALVPIYLKEVPTDPYDGQPIRYRRTADGVVVYSVGQDRTDNQGNLVRNAAFSDGHDLGFQLWDVANRRQPSSRKGG